ncbi:hypothetical protein SPI_04053 [Niveomyces insectorum RCEF 264]|uniref:Zinc finger, RING/FYVE/PHD-type n=1 Tax=Niveomyces insectorum RCEF 264 TaxID=1081102 RepID=A0A167VE43_9HYPO|nr:hypothetical protein SPI_04053 [Niveomyces insectorum RCEF 264]
MSSPAQGGPSAPKEKKGVSSRVLTRMKTIIKRAEKRLSVSGPSKAGPSSATAQPAAVPAAASATAEPSAPGAPAAVAEPAEAAAAAAAATPGKGKKPKAVYPDATRVSRMQIHEERARKLGERFGLEIQPSEWHATEGDALRVNKPIRMRVHRICHVCSTEFGTAKECASCKHVRCKKCARYPPKLTEAEKAASRERRAAILREQREKAPIVPDWDPERIPITLTRPSKTGGRDLVYKKPRQRLRRTCCQCNKLFVSGNKTCQGCNHPRCTDCPRDPPKKEKYPYGYPGDEFGARSIPRYKCHVCATKYPPEAPEGTACAQCTHQRCGDCPRLKPQRVEPEPDPEILRTIEARLSKLKVG